MMSHFLKQTCVSGKCCCKYLTVLPFLLVDLQHSCSRTFTNVSVTSRCLHKFNVLTAYLMCNCVDFLLAASMFSLCSCFQADVCLIMSKRGRRRSSRRKSSSSNKQSESPFIFLKQNKSNSVSDKDDITEKGETDSLRKENVSLGSEDEEVYDNTRQKEKRFKPESPPNQRTRCSATPDDRGVTVVTSVSISDIATSAPKITFQQSHKPQSEDPSDTSTPVTSEVKIKCIGSQVRLEIHENLQFNAPGVKTTFVFMNEKGVSVETSLKSQWERMWTPNNEPPEPMIQSLNVIRQNGTKDMATYNLTLDTHEQNNDSSGTKTWSPYSENSSGFSLTCRPLVPKAQRKRDTFQKSFSTDQVQQTLPPHNFSAVKYNSLDGLTHQLSSWRIAAYPNEKQQEFYPTPHMVPDEEFGYQTSAHNNKRADVALCFDHLSGSDHFESMFSRASSSVNRFSFDFIDTQTRKSWIRNHSIGALKIKASLSPQKRRQTFPGLSEDLLAYSPSFSSTVSSIMSSLPVHADGLMGIYHSDDKLPAFGIEDYPSHTRWNSNRHSNTSDCGDSPRKFFTICEQCRRKSKTQTFEDLRQQDLEHVRKNADDCREEVDQSEAADTGSKQETGEAEPDKHTPLTDEFFGDSEDQMSENNPVMSIQDGLVQDTSIEAESCDGSDKLRPTETKSSVPTLTAAASEQRFLQMEADNSSENDPRYDLSATLEEPCMSPLLAVHSVHSLNPHEVGEDISSETEAELTGKLGSSSPSLRTEEAKDLHLEKQEFKKPESEVSKCFTDHNAKNNRKDSLPETDKNDKQFARRYSSEMKERLKPLIPKEPDGSSSEHWAKRRKLFKESKQWSSAGGNSVTSDITEESGNSVSEENRSMEMSVGETEDRGFYTETFHSVSWIYQGDDSSSSTLPPSLSTKPRAASVRERTVRISKGTGEYPWGFRIQFSKPIVVTEVDTNGAAEEAGLTVGDYVLAVNGTDVTTVPHSEAAHLARQGPDVLTLTIGSDIARCPNTPRPACRGYLHKRTQSGLIKGWRKRWFVLTHDCCLYYYRHKRDEGKGRALLSVKLEGAEVAPDNSLGKPFVFKCRPQPGDRVYFFCATSKQQMKRWLEAMRNAVYPVTQNHVWVDVTRHNSNLPPLAVKNPECLGLLHTTHRSQDTWMQHYCILKDGCLYLYSGIRATHAHGGIYLQGYMVREQPYGSKKSTIELKPPSDEFKTFYLSAENPSENKRWIVAIRASINKWLPLHQALQGFRTRPPEETRM